MSEKPDKVEKVLEISTGNEWCVDIDAEGNIESFEISPTEFDHRDCEGCDLYNLCGLFDDVINILEYHNL